MSKLEANEKERLNWDNNFSIRFKLQNGKNLEKIPNNIFMIELPDISSIDMNADMLDKNIKLTLRSTQDGSVEREVYDVLFRTNFDIELSLSNPNKIDYIYKSCSVEKLQFAPLMNRPKANPFNFTVDVDYKYATYFNSGESFTFGDAPLDLSDIKQETIEGTK